MQSVTSNAVYGFYKKKIVTKSVTVNAQDAVGGSVSVIDDGYEAVMAVITNTGDNKLYAYRQNFTSQGLFYYSLQNWNTIAITVNIEITVLERKI